MERRNWNVSPPQTNIWKFVDRLSFLYITYRKKFVMMKNGSTFVPKRGENFIPLTNTFVRGHINREYAICVYAPEDKTKFICFDVDNGSAETVDKIIACISGIGISRDRIYVSTSGGKGYHVEIFFDALVDEKLAWRFYDYVCTETGSDEKKVEFAPTSSKSIKLPLSIHRITGNVCWYLDRDSLVPIEDMSYLFEIKQISAELFEDLVDEKIHKRLSIQENYSSNSSPVLTPEEAEAFSEGRYPDIAKEGERHSLMVKIAASCNYRGLSKTACYDLLEEWYKRQNKTLVSHNDEYVMTDLAKIVEWTYSESFKKTKTFNREIIFDNSDFRSLASQTVSGRRKFVFLLLLCKKKFGSMKLSEKKIGEVIGLSTTALKNTIVKTAESGWVFIKAGKSTRLEDGRFIHSSNIYWVCRGATDWAERKTYSCPGDDWERGHLIDRMSLSKEPITVGTVMDFKITSENFDAAYTSVLRHMTDDATLEKIMTKKEYATFMSRKEEKEAV